MKPWNFFKPAMTFFAAALLAAGCRTVRPVAAGAPVDPAITAAELAAVFEPADSGVAKPEGGDLPDRETLTPEEALRVAAEKNPAFAEYAAAREAALAEVMAAKAWAGPALELGAGRGKTRGTPSVSGFEYGIGLFQPIEWPGKRGVRREAAEAGVKVAELDGALFRVTLRADVLRAYWTAAGCARERELGRLLKEFADSAQAMAEAKAAAGELDAAGLSSFRLDALKAEQEKRLAETQAGLAAGLLRRLCGGGLTEGIPGGGLLLPAAPTVRLEKARELAVKKHPAVLKLEAEKRRAELAVRQAELASRPDLTPGVELNRGVDVTSWGAKLAASLPFWNRNKAGVAAAKAELKRVEAQLAVKRVEVAANVEAAALEHAVAIARMECAVKAVGVAVQASSAAHKLWELGEIDRAAYVALLRDREQLNREAYRAATAATLAKIQLEQAIGYGEMK